MLSLAAAPAASAAGGGVTFHTDPAAFQAAVEAAGKVSKGSWSFEPNNLAPGAIVGIDDFLDIDSHPMLAPGVWDNKDGSTFWPASLDNVQFASSTNPGGALEPVGGTFGLYFDQGFIGPGNPILGADFFAAFNILSGPPAGDNHTAMALEIVEPLVAEPALDVFVYDKQDTIIGTTTLAPATGEKAFLGITAPAGQTIGRVEIDETAGDGAPGIASIDVYLVQEPLCPWDCQADGPDKEVGINDFLDLLVQWQLIGVSCDLGIGVPGAGIEEFIAVLQNWGPCPSAPNDECAGKTVIYRIEAEGEVVEHLDMYGATPSPEPVQCTGADQNPFKDVWYCLVNSSGDQKLVTVTGDVDLLVEATAGCACPPGALLACGRTSRGASFTLDADASACVRLLNDLGLPNDQLKGDVVFTNGPVEPPGDVNLFIDFDAFTQAAADAGKTQKLFWAFEPNAAGPAFGGFVANPLDIDTHDTGQSDPWTDAANNDLWPPSVDNLQFVSNDNPQGKLVPGDPVTGLVFLTAGFNADVDNSVVVENTASSAIDIVSGPPAGGNHTAIAVELFSSGVNQKVPPGSPVTYRVTLFDKQDKPIGEFEIPGFSGPTKTFAGFLTKDPQITIGRVDAFTEEGLFDGISAVWAYE